MIRSILQKRKADRQSLQSRKKEVIVHKNPKSPVTEAFRNIRTNLAFLSPDRTLRTVAITSSVASEGKSFVLVNIAVSRAQMGNNVIIIDADMRKPTLHRFFDLTNTSGLSNILSGEIELVEGLKTTDIEGVRIITAGKIPPNPAELLGSRKMEEVLERACEEADIVFIDTPPVLAVTDAAILSNRVDGTILVAASHQVDRNALLKANEFLINAKARVLGIVLNKYPLHRNRSDGYYYYGR
ncbi:MAG: CpsD/CapB family tyrosine-protein kinase [Halanaerobiaceae bacterium]|jgi:capsular exopolysaccharide synthesis family protein|nr:CpsD/CapB family tyrosine-protein kinase [Halanaerobiaceae bacterium]